MSSSLHVPSVTPLPNVEYLYLPICLVSASSRRNVSFVYWYKLFPSKRPVDRCWVNKWSSAQNPQGRQQERMRPRVACARARYTPLPSVLAAFLSLLVHSCAQQALTLFSFEKLNWWNTPEMSARSINPSFNMFKWGILDIFAKVLKESFFHRKLVKQCMPMLIVSLPPHTCSPFIETKIQGKNEEKINNVYEMLGLNALKRWVWNQYCFLTLSLSSVAKDVFVLKPNQKILDIAQNTVFGWHRHELCRDRVKRDCDQKSLLRNEFADLGPMIFSVDASLLLFPILEFFLLEVTSH